ncbi:MAG: phage tail sheath subtilisin-like domain-containing protein [Deltaproteobacteria bacterium]|nr:phage tail sheath subtilisin-like domain-containing protein [Deltaproteobacteria bacterium]
MTRIIPGVQVAVVKEVVPPQLAPSGVLGLIGITEKVPDETERASSWSRFVEVFGPGSAYSMPEAKQALQNGVFELVVIPVGKDKGTKAAVQIYADKDKKKKAFKLVARAAGPWANDLKVKITSRKTADDKNVFDLEMERPGSGEFEMHRNLSMSPSIGKEANPRYVGTVLKDVTDKSGNVTTYGASAIVTIEDIQDKVQIQENLQPDDVVYKLSGGADAGEKDYCDALKALVNEPDVDMVLASIQDAGVKAEKAIKINSEIIAHCQVMSEDSKGRIGFGQVKRDMKPKEMVEMASNLVSDRFVLLAPYGVAGAVAGMIGGLNYYYSPTFKNVSGLGAYSSGLGLEDQRTLLKGNVVPVVKERGRGIIVLRGLTTDGDQISVRRVADRAVRGVKMIGELFIGRLNTEDGRGALKQKLIEFLVQMEKENAIVPSTDGLDPAFKVDVYSSQADFAKGIVRVDMAVRPVRAIDFIYATVLVQV